MDSDFVQGTLDITAIYIIANSKPDYANMNDTCWLYRSRQCSSL